MHALAPDISHAARERRKTGHRIHWEGALFAHHSLATVNRELASRLVERGHSISFERSEPDAFQPDESVALHARLARSLLVDERVSRDRAELDRTASVDVRIRHHWPPDFTRPTAGRLVLIQPWEYGSLPREWVAPLRRNVDEVWVPTSWVRDTYVRAGLDPERVHVVPNGVDTRRFHPKAAPHRLETRAAFRFLFVGGALPRKGVHVLLEAWKRAFTAADDVALVVKDFGASTVYRGQSLRALVEVAAAQVDSAEIRYLDDTLDDAQMPGLFTACDVLVHPYLAEGFGLPIAEAMACARPAIVTGGGAALDFCNAQNAWLIPAQIARMSEARVGDLETLERPIVWEPNVDALASILRSVAADRAGVVARGRIARESIRANFTWEHAADACEKRLDALVHDRTPRTAEREPIDAVEPVPIRFGAAPFNWSGYARLARMLLPALDAAGARASLQPYAVDRRFLEKLGPEALATWRDLLTREAGDGVHVAFHPPVGWDGYRFLRNARAQNPHASAHVGYTMFETDRLPKSWAEELSEMDEVWVPCRFNLETFARAGVPEHKLKLYQPGLDLAPFTRNITPFPIPGRAAFTFLSVFQWTRRKGWDVLIEAFVRAFTRRDDVRLVIRAYPGERKDPPIKARVAQHLRLLGVDPSDAPEIVVIDEFVSEAVLPSLYAAADAYVLPTRGEGFGLPFLEAMAAGLPTIGTRWSGQLDFLDDDVGYLIDIDGLENVDPEQTAENPYYEADHRWARPNVAHTAELMRRVFERRDEARERGQQARARVFADWSAERGAQRFVALARDLHRRAPQSGTRARSSPRMAPVLWQGPLLGISGYADEGRDMVAGLDALGVRLRVVAQQWGEPAPLDREEGERLSRVASTTLFESPVAIVHGFGGTAQRVEAARANVCRTMFETDRAPASWVAPLNAMDEVWVPGRFQVDAFARAGVERSKLHVVHGTIDARRYAQLPAPQAIDGTRAFNFLSVFDWSVRKGWDVLLRAWVAAFKPRDDVALILKVHSTLGLTTEDIRARIRSFVRDECGRDPDAIPPVLLITARPTRDELLRLFVAADAYVMPSRGEGWGRPFVEAMACGLPVIATRWGGSLEFLDDDVAFLCDAREVDVPAEAIAEQPLFAGHLWGEPSVEHVTQLLRRVHRDTKTAARIGARARTRALERFDRTVVAQQIQTRLVELGLPTDRSRKS